LIAANAVWASAANLEIVAAISGPVYITSSTYALGVAPGASIQLFGHAFATKGAAAATIPVRIAAFAVASDTPA
jgi:hypothetical protein